MAKSKTQQTPPMRSSDEANQEQLQLAREQGDAMQHAVQTMTQREAHGQAKQAGDYLIGYAIEEAEGLYHLRDGKLQWQDPQDENVHVEVVVCDGADKRFIPYLAVYATLIDSKGQDVGTHLQPFLWHPWLFHYGRNWKVPGDGEYTLRIRVEVPDFPRHDKMNGDRYTEPVEVEFTEVQIETGQKKS